MKTIEYKFIPINQRDRLELDELYRRIKKESPNKYPYTESGKQKLIRFLSVNKRLDLIKRSEITWLVVNRLDGDFINSATVDCGEFGVLSFNINGDYWISGFVPFVGNADYKVEWI